ncbi:hypothetical protein D3C80_1162360 [compost metagenome]
MDFNDIAVSIFNDVIAFDEVSMLQTDLVPREQPEIFAWRILHEILSLNINFTRERDLAIAHFRIFTVVFRFKQLGLSLRVIRNDNLERVNHSHRTRRLQL